MNDSSLSQSPLVICLGEALIDRLGPLGGDPSIDKPVEDCYGGAPANVACCLARLGDPVSFVGRLGDDLIGRSFRDLMLARGIHLAGLQVDLSRPTRIVLVRRDHNGERSFQGFRKDEGFGFADQALALENLTSTWPLIANQASWLLLGTIPLATMASAETLIWSIENALQNHIKIALDINWRATFWNPKDPPESGPNQQAMDSICPLLEKVSLIKLAKEEANWFFNSPDPLEISKSLPQCPNVVVTDGSHPINWLIDGFRGEMAVVSSQPVIDTTGAGDAFMAGLLHQLLRCSSNALTSEKVQEMIRFAAACGALVCMGAGAIAPQPTHDEVITFLSES